MIVINTQQLIMQLNSFLLPVNLSLTKLVMFPFTVKKGTSKTLQVPVTKCKALLKEMISGVTKNQFTYSESCNKIHV